MSSLNNAVRVPTLPIEIWFETGASYICDVTDDYVRLLHVKERKTRRFAGRKYLNALLEVATPEELGRFVGEFGCPTGKFGWFVFPLTILWNDFLEVQNQLREVIVLPESKLLLSEKVRTFVDPDTFDIKVERREKVYYGTLIKDAVWESCYTVIIFERLLAGINYGLCEYCGKPFEISSGHARKYCPYPATCGHAVAQRAYRGRKNKPPEKKSAERKGKR
jgi:hypothetical protein